jgi:ligand-binding sensor domain-containing protein
MFIRFIVILVFFSQVVFSQSPAIKRYLPRPDGLPQVQVMRTQLAPDGALWVATYGGIGRFNGKKFTNYTIRNGLSSNLTYDIGFLNDTIWMLTRDGLDILVHNELKNLLKPDSKFSDGKLYLHNTLTKYVYNLGTDQFVDQNMKLRLFDINKRGYTDNIIIETELPLINGIIPNNKEFYYAWGHYLGKFSFHSLKGKILREFSNRVVGLSGENNRFLVFTLSKDNGQQPLYDTLFLYTISNNNFIEQSVDITGWGQLRKQVAIYRCFYLQANDILIFDRSSQIWQLKNNKITSFATNINNLNHVLLNNTSYWLSTEKGLVKRFDDGFQYFRPEVGFPENVWSVLPIDTKRALFASFSNGLFMVQDNLSSLIHVPIYPVYNNIQYTYYNGALKGFKKDVIIPHSAGVTVLDIPTLKAKEITENMNQPSLTLFKVEESKTILIGNMSNLVEMDTNYRTRILFSVNLLGIKTTILAIEDYNQNYLLGLGRGLVEFDPKTDNGKVLMHSNVRVNDLITDSTGTIWAATNLGLMYFNGDSLLPLFSSFIDEDLLTLTISNDNRLFIGGSGTLYTLNLRKYHQGKPNCMLAYCESAGYQSGEPGQNSFYKDEQGILWLPTSENVVKINPDLLPEPHHLAKAVLVTGFATNAKYNDTLVINQNTNSVSLPFSYNNLHLEYEAVELDFPESLKFQYKLDDEIDNWTSLDDETNLNFNNLNPGNYTLHVRATINESFLEAPEAILNITIIPPFWLTWWFIGFCIILTLIIIWFIVLYFIRRERKKAFQHSEMLRLKSQAMGIQINNHFLVNCTVKIAMLNQEGKTAAATDYSNYFVRFLQGNLRSLRKELVTLADELEMIESYVKIEQFGNASFTLNIQVDPDIDPDKIIIPPFLIQPLVENSIRHGLKKRIDLPGLIEISVSRKNIWYILIRVIDNGKGLSDEKSTGNHIGMKIIKERLKFIGKGSEISITPLEPGLMVELIICIH